MEHCHLPNGPPLENYKDYKVTSIGKLENFQQSNLLCGDQLSYPRMAEGVSKKRVEEVWGEGEEEGLLNREEEEEGVKAWLENCSAGRVTLSIQGFHHFVKPIIFQGDPILSSSVLQ